MLEAAAYQALEIRGPHRHRVFAFARLLNDQAVICVVPRLAHSVADGQFAVGVDRWADTAIVLPGGADMTYRDLVTGATVAAHDGLLSVGSVFGVLPLGLLEAQ
jgi:(1->4)-alpha-D-glucan 1-alpha-D-glucosylmutase